MERILYGKTRAGEEVDCFIIKNANGLEVRCINYGCAITGILVPTAAGPPVDVVLGFDSLSGYEEDEGTYQGRVVGRYANRIKNAAFSLDGREYTLMKNNGENYLHGSFHKRVWAAEVIGDNSVSFTYTSPDGEDGFPGELWASVTYTLTGSNELMIDYRAVPKAPTHVNLTNHAYFNLAGSGHPTVEDHLLTLNCDLFLEGGNDLCPTGRMLETAGGAFDFSTPKPIGRDINAKDPQLELAGGYDHCFIVNRESPAGLALAAKLEDPASGHAMRVYTTQPGMQVYTGNFLSGAPGKKGAPMAKRSAVCLETQHFPCTPNGYEDFPPTLLQAGEKYRQSTVLQFSF